MKYQNQQHHDWDDFTKDIQIVSQEKSTADNIDEDALAMLEKYDLKYFAFLIFLFHTYKGQVLFLNDDFQHEQRTCKYN